MIRRIKLLALALLLVACPVFANDFVALQIYPEHVGVFTADGEQQFVAFGIRADGSRENITKLVDWESSDPSTVTIDAKGLARVAIGKTYGQVRISCFYPKTEKSRVLPGVLSLLLSKPDVKEEETPPLSQLPSIYLLLL